VAQHSSSHAKSGDSHHAGHTPARVGAAPGSSQVALSLRPSGPVYVCLLGEAGRKLIAGQILQPGTTEPTYRAKHFVLTLGNSSVQLLIDGVARVVPPSSNAIGYSITKAGRRTLAAGSLPTCK
jgi:hypothetical protein